MFIGVQPVKAVRCHREKVSGIVPGESAARKATKRKVPDVTNAVALIASKTATTISKADTLRVNTQNATGVSACLRCKILCCCLT